MHIQYTPSINETKTLESDPLRKGFLLEDLFSDGEIRTVVTDLDRAIVGGIRLQNRPLLLTCPEMMRAKFFCERRELGLLNIGDTECRVTVDSEVHSMAPLDCLYVGRGSETIEFSGPNAELYFVSYPAHKQFPTRKMEKSEANHVVLGTVDKSNERILHQYICEGGIPSCQLVMGYTEIMPGSCWNTMPPHTHQRRSEIYLYFDIPESDVVFHFMGEPRQTRHLIVRNQQAALSPDWSIHAGCGTSPYCFVWAMGGENQRFDDMDPVPLTDLR